MAACHMAMVFLLSDTGESCLRIPQSGIHLRIPQLVLQWKIVINFAIYAFNVFKFLNFCVSVSTLKYYLTHVKFI